MKWPLDRRLMQQYLSTPSIEKCITHDQAALHEALAPLVDQEKHRQQIQRLRNAPPTQGFDVKTFMLRRNMMAIRQLNAWLNCYF